MAWRKTVTDILTDVLHFIIRGALLVNGILLAAASVYITSRFCWHFVQWLDRLWFSRPW